VVSAPPHFDAHHTAIRYLPLDGGPLQPADCVQLSGGQFKPGVRGQAYDGQITVTAPGLFHCEEGTLEFWLRPQGINSLSDRNRTFVGGPFNFYLLNGGTHEPSLYFGDPEMGLHFVHTTIETHPGRWYHFVITWLGPEITIYLDGQRTAGTYGRWLINGGQKTTDRFQFNGHESIGLFDEIRVYDRALVPAEAANAYWRYRDPSKLTADVRVPAMEIAGEYLPADRKIAYRLTPRIPLDAPSEIALELRDESKVLQRWTRPWSEDASGELNLPELPDGQFVVATSVRVPGKQPVDGGQFRFVARRFPWENNTLGITDQVYPPFVPIHVEQESASVVSRRMKFNGHGLWDSLESLGRELLAGPMTVRFETESGEETLVSTGRRWIRQEPKEAVFEAQSQAEAVAIKTRSSVEIDGCTKVEMTLRPGSKPAAIKRLWIEIALRDAEVPLMHTIGDGLRSNYSGAVPTGQGVVWDGTKAHRDEHWRNAFVPYVWLGGPERGLALFAENDRGWVTEKGRSKLPTHEIERRGDRLILRAYLVNRPITLTEARQLVFGLQASPTKPLPDDWRKRVPDAPGGLAVVPWGGIQCASQGPYGDDWTIVEKVLEARRGLPLDQAWMDDYAKRNHPPKVHNESDWTYYLGHFASRAKDVGLSRPIAVYQEEMRAAHSRPEWIVYQDQWKTLDGPQSRTQPDGLDLRGGHRSFSGISEITFARSYADFGVWIANQWLSRGVSLYWDNTYLYPSYNTRTTAAYLAEDGYIQPALTIWNVREYQKRVWHLLQEWRGKRSEPLEWTLHMTNTLVLPVHTWGTVDLDHELAVKRPFSPEWLLTETIGRQIGNLPLSLYEVVGRNNEIANALPAQRRNGIEWAMRAVHEIQRGGFQEKVLVDFGYGQPGVTVHNYWADVPALRVSNPQVKWLALAKPATHEMLLVLASWSEEAAVAEVRLDPAMLGLSSLDGLHATDVDAKSRRDASQPFQVTLPGPWGNCVLKVEAGK
jgi:hypothetical protein